MTKPFSAGLAVLLSTAAAFAQSPQRPPAVPLIAADPYFSVWSMNDRLTDGPTRHWTGRPHRLTSMVHIDGKPFRLMGQASPDVTAAKQVALTVMPTRSIYEFEEGGVRLTLTFMSPMLPDDLMVMSRPVTYVTWSAKSTDNAAHDVSVYIDADAELSVERPEQIVASQPGQAGGLTTLRVGTVDQPVLATRGDDLRIDWGYFYLASNAKATTIAPAKDARGAFAKDGSLPQSTTAATGPAKAAPVLANAFDLGKVSATPVSAYAMVAYDDSPGSIRYFNTDLKGYWTKDGVTITDLLQTAEKEYESLVKRCEAFDNELVADMKKIGGESYVRLGVLAWRQALAAQKICVDANGQPLSFSKENNSNGCIATVDLLYPASPQLLAFSPSLLKASLVPLLDYSASTRWKFDSAPHDLGTYPHATGQVYGGENTSPMPVEESGNMLIILAALAKTEGNAEFSRKYWPTLTVWAEYLRKHGLDPANQLTTDDFAGHIARNTNLSAKAIMGIASYGLMADMLGKKDEAAAAMKTAREYAQTWTEMAAEGDHYMLVFGEKGQGTWSQKYNLVWDKLLGLNIFPPEVVSKEMAYYKTKINPFGLPLDSRKAYTKLDWSVWTATMAENRADFQAIIDACARFADETPDRVPLSDWYETESGKQTGFKARTAVGGVFMPFLKEEAMWKKYASRDKAQLGGWAETDFAGPEFRIVVAAADTEPATWKYTTEKPQGDWKAADYDDSQWKTGKGGFGTSGTPAAVVGTEWNSSDIYLRRTFTLPEKPARDLQFWLHHDEDLEIYLNGATAVRLHGFLAQYIVHRIDDEGRAALKPGKNVMAVHCHQTGAGQYVDVGLVDVIPMKKK